MLIREHLEDGATIYTGDEFQADYCTFTKYYTNKVVVKKNEPNFGFKERITDKIEFFRAHLQRVLYSHPMHKDYQVQASVDEAIWRRRHKLSSQREKKLIEYMQFIDV